MHTLHPEVISRRIPDQDKVLSKNPESVFFQGIGFGLLPGALRNLNRTEEYWSNFIEFLLWATCSTMNSFTGQIADACVVCTVDYACLPPVNRMQACAQGYLPLIEYAEWHMNW